VRPKQIVLVRHGESELNVARMHSPFLEDEAARDRMKGIPDHRVRLSARGLEQARQTGLALRERYGVPDYLYHSGYARTVQTAEQILAAYPLSVRERIKVRANIFIRERDSGYGFNMTRAEVEKAFPFLEDYWSTFGGFYARPPGGESIADVTERVYLFLNMLFRDRAGKRIFVVTHGRALQSFRFLLERWTIEHDLRQQSGESPKNCSVTVYNYDECVRRLVLSEYNKVFWKA
jgi:2,3-bisphosphoglycerate-dependent phosphoglycerate mutase